VIAAAKRTLGSGQPGPGRPALPAGEKRIAFTVTLPPDALELLDELVGLFAGSRSELLEYLVRKEARCERRKD
jgi:hypothetical protein